MGKKKDKADRAEKAGRIPKRIGGVKLPKELRHKGEALLARATSPEGRAALAKGLTVAATFANLAVEHGKTAAPKPAARPDAAAAPANDAAPASPIDPQKVAEAVSTVANEVLGRLFGGKKA
ncbi:hypothetical protein [uncultured Sphingomonas sp.]|uniref:hypothetical protein n=1 Tax=uncultured Sphingomonas sp. TaxID=158754 RepID=UPI0035C99130